MLSLPRRSRSSAASLLQPRRSRPLNEAVFAAPVERRTAGRLLEERLLVLAPTGDDATLIAGILRARDLDVITVTDAPALADEITRGAAVVLIASEALDEPGSASVLQRALEGQEPWSEMPIVLFGGDVEDTASR